MQSGPDLEIIVPSELEAGSYANLLASWHSAHEFTLDFAVTLRPEVTDPEATKVRVVARVKLPVTVVFDVIRTLNYEMTLYENRFGEIRRPEPRDEGPEVV